MPFYEYRCLGCGREFEMSKKVEDRNEGLECPKCEGELTLLVSVPGKAVVPGGTGAARGSR